MAFSGPQARGTGLGMRKGLDQVTSERGYMSEATSLFSSPVFPSTPFRIGGQQWVSHGEIPVLGPKRAGFQSWPLR